MRRLNNKGTFTLSQLLPHKDTSHVAGYSSVVTEDGKIEITLYNKEAKEIPVLPGVKLRATKNLKHAVKSATDRCFKQSKAELPNGTQEEISELYRKKLSTLDTDILEGILYCHNKGLFGRANITLQAVSNELAARVLLNDSSQKK